MQTEVATLKSEILGLQVDSNQIKFLIVDYQAQITADNATSAANKEVIDRLTNTGTDYNAKITSLYDDAAADFKTLESAKITYDNANNAYNVAGAKATNSATAYSAVITSATDTLTQYNAQVTALSGYNTLANLNLAVAENTTEVNALTTIANNWQTLANSLYATKAVSSAENDRTHALYLIAQAEVDKAQLNGGTALPSQITARDNASTNYNTANSTFTSDKSNYDSAVLKVTSSTTALNKSTTALAALTKKTTDYATAKGLFDIAKAAYTLASANLPALLAAKNADLLAYNSLKAPRDAALTAKTIAQANYKAKDDALTLLKSDGTTLATSIATIRASENTIQKNLQKNGDILGQLTTAGYNADTKTIVKEWIAAAQEKIRALNLIIGSSPKTMEWIKFII